MQEICLKLQKSLKYLCISLHYASVSKSNYAPSTPIHPFSVTVYPVLRVMGVLEPIAAILG